MLVKQFNKPPTFWRAILPIYGKFGYGGSYCFTVPKLAAEGCWFHTSGAPDCDGLSPGWSRSTSAKTLSPPGMPTGKIWKDWMMEDPNLDPMLIPTKFSRNSMILGHFPDPMGESLPDPHREWPTWGPFWPAPWRAKTRLMPWTNVDHLEHNHGFVIVFWMFTKSTIE